MTRTSLWSAAVITAAVIAALWFTVAAAQAQTVCGQRDSVVAKLAEEFGETRRGGGLAGPTAIIEIWTSEATGTWTILQTTPAGFSCIVAAGDNWQDDPPVTSTSGKGA